jgi:hypothetical protein
MKGGLIKADFRLLVNAMPVSATMLISATTLISADDF